MRRRAAAGIALGQAQLGRQRHPAGAEAGAVRVVALLAEGTQVEVGNEIDVVRLVRAPHVLAEVAARAKHRIGHGGAAAAEGECAGAGGRTACAPGCHTLNEGQRRLCQTLQLCGGYRRRKWPIVW